LVIADTAHNVAGMQIVLEQLKKQKAKKKHFVLGLVNDKDIRSILDLLPQDAIYYFCKADIPRALVSDELREIARNFGLEGNAYASVMLAYQAALLNASNEDLIYVGGSTFVVAEVL